MREVNKRLIYANYIIDVWVNRDGSVEYTVNDGKLQELDIEISESVHNYYVNPCNEYLTKLEEGTKSKCIWYVIDYIRQKIEDAPRETTN